MAGPEGHSISSSVSIPQWMKNKMNTFDFEQSAFSPTEIDDSYLLYRFPREQLKEKQPHANNNGGPKLDPSKYTLHCQKYLKDGSQCSTAQKVVHPIQAKIKSSGVDDGFKGEAAKCGSSIISLANTIVANNTKVIKGFTVEENELNETEGQSPLPNSKHLMRRGSKSLPASPMGSPKTMRKNKYFTPPYVESEKYPGSWILSNLLGKRETISQSCDLIAEDESEDAKSLSPKTIRKLKPTFVPKPSELREMNFWSPTSM